MNRIEFYNYIVDNYDLSVEALKLIYNILLYVELNFSNDLERYNALNELLDESIGITESELRNIRF